MRESPIYVLSNSVKYYPWKAGVRIWRRAEIGTMLKLFLEEMEISDTKNATVEHRPTQEDAPEEDKSDLGLNIWLMQIRIQQKFVAFKIPFKI